MRSPLAAVEAQHLTVVCAGGLLALLGTASRAPVRLSLVAVAALVPLALWALPTGVARASAIALLLAAAWAFAAAGLERQPGPFALRCLQLTSLAFALQLQGRGRVLVTESPLRAAVILLALPVIASCAAVVLERRFGLRGLAACAAVIAVTGSVTLTATGVLAAAAACSTLAARAPHWQTAAVLALLGALLAWSLPIGATALLAGLYLAGLRRWPAVWMVTAGVLLALAPVRAWDLPGELATLAAAGAFVLVATAATRGSWQPVAVSFGLAVVGLRFLEPHEALAAPALLLVLCAGRSAPDADCSSTWSQSIWPGAQATWCVALLAAACAQANYPWHWPADLHAVLQHAPWAAALPALATTLFLLERNGATRLRAFAWAAAFVTLVAVPRVQPSTVLLDWPPTTLTHEAPAWQSPLGLQLEAGSAALLVDTSLSHALDLAPGTQVASVELLGAGDEVTATWPLRAGLDTAEWAADRTGAPRPSAHLSWLDPEGGFFAHRYRARLRWPNELGAARVRIRLEAPDGVELTLHRVRAEGAKAEPPS